MIGVFDSGHGGLTVLAALTRRLPEQAFIYLGDHANAPYGNRAPDEIYHHTLAALERLFSLGCGLVVIACNTAVATGLRRLQQDWLPRHYPDRRVIGVLVPVVEAITGVTWTDERRFAEGLATTGTIAVLATRHTVNSRTFTREITRRAPALSVVEQACPVLVTLIEAAAPEPIIARAVRRYTKLLERQLRGVMPSAVILGCTHYPLISHLFRAALPSGAPILSQPDITAEGLAAYLDRHPRFIGQGNGPPQFYTTGSAAQVTPLATRFYGGAAPFSTITTTAPLALIPEALGDDLWSSPRAPSSAGRFASANLGSRANDGAGPQWPIKGHS